MVKAISVALKEYLTSRQPSGISDNSESSVDLYRSLTAAREETAAAIE